MPATPNTKRLGALVITVVAAVAALTATPSADAGTGAPITTVVPLPAAITAVQFPSWTADGSRIIAAASSTDFAGTNLVTFTAAGTDLRCLTCGAWTGAEPLLKSFPFADGRRVLVRIGEQTELTPADHGVVECTPSVLDCRSAVVVPITPPAGSDSNVVQDQREYRIAPDGRHVALTQARRSATGQFTLTGIVGELVRGGSTYEVANARAVSTGGEIKGFTPDGQSVLHTRYSRGAEAANPDDFAVDLRTGQERRVTYAADWDEDVDISGVRYAGREWMVVGSARGTGTLETVSQVRRPAAIDPGIDTLALRAFQNRTAERAEPWLVSTDGERTRQPGRPLTPGALADGWDARPNFLWNPDGTAIVHWQRRVGSPGSRVVVTRLPRRPAVPPPVAATPQPAWAPPLDGFVPPDAALLPSRDGRHTGHMSVVQRPSPVAGYDFLLEVTFTGFSDETGFVLDGVERSLYGGAGTARDRSLYSADLRVSGHHTGYLRANDVKITAAGVAGTFESALDGRTLTLTLP